MRFAYADPPYIGQAKKRYKHDPKCEEVDHYALLKSLDKYDGWALSCSTPSLGLILSMCSSLAFPFDVRVAAWVKPFAVFKPGVNPAYAWEPVVFVPSPRKRSRKEPTVRDWVSANITLKKGLCGAKPEPFCRWLFELLGMTLNDTLDDLFPGTGIVTRSWEQWKQERA